jgi:hypothetical protein
MLGPNGKTKIRIRPPKCIRTEPQIALQIDGGAGYALGSEMQGLRL